MGGEPARCEGTQVAPSVSFVVFPGSHRILEVMAREGLLADLLAAGATSPSRPAAPARASATCRPRADEEPARVQPQLPGPERHGKDDSVYLCSPLTAAVSAVTGVHHRSAQRAARRADAALPGVARGVGWPGCLPPAPAADAAAHRGAQGAEHQDVPRGRPVPTSA